MASPSLCPRITCSGYSSSASDAVGQLSLSLAILVPGFCYFKRSNLAEQIVLLIRPLASPSFTCHGKMNPASQVRDCCIIQGQMEIMVALSVVYIHIYIYVHISCMVVGLQAIRCHIY